MNQISPEQWQSLGERSFDTRMIAVIRENHAQQAAAASDDVLRREIARQRLRATRYGLTDERSAATFVYAAWLLGAEFDTRIPALAQVLGDPALAASRKTKALNDFSQVVFRALDGAAAARASGAPAA